MSTAAYEDAQRSVVAELSAFLRQQTVLSWRSDSLRSLTHLVLGHLPPDATARERGAAPKLATMAIFEAVCGSEVPNASGHKPLAAAYQLLAMGTPYPLDPAAPIPGVGYSRNLLWARYESGGKRERPRNVDPLTRQGPRHLYAAIAGGYGSSTTAFGLGTRALEEVATAVFEEIVVLLRREDWKDILERREQTLRRLFDPLRALVAPLTAQLDAPPATYPRHFRPTVLAGSMTISRVGPSKVMASAQSIYSGRVSAGGSSAVDTLRDLHRAALIGDPGSGKSTIGVSLLCLHLETGNGMFVRLADWGARLASFPPKSSHELAGSLVACLGHWFDKRITDETRDALIAAILEDDRFLIVLDGLDEVEGGHYSGVEKGLRDLDILTKGSLCFTSRLSGYEPPIEAATFHVDRLESPMEFLRLWHPEGTPGRERIERLDYREDLLDLLATPVFAGIAGLVADYEELPSSLGDLYGTYLDLLLSRKWKVHVRRDPLERVELTKLAEELAWRMATQSTSAPRQIDAWTDVVSLGSLAEMTAPADRVLLRTLVSVDGLLVPHGQGPHEANRRQYRWLHRTLHEYLVASHLARWLLNDFDCAVRYAWQALLRPRTWATALTYAVGMLPAHVRDQLVTSLARSASDFDSDSAVLDVLLRLARHSAPRTLESVIDSYVARGQWQVLVKAYDSEVEERIFLRHKGELREPDLSPLAMNFSVSLTSDTIGLGLSMLELFDAAGAWTSGREYLVASIARYEPDVAVAHLKDHLDGGSCHQMSIVHADVENPEMVREVSERMARAPFDELEGLSALLHFLERGPREHGVLIETCSLVRADAVLKRVDLATLTDEEREIWSQAARGSFGARAADEVAARAPAILAEVPVEDWPLSARATTIGAQLERALASHASSSGSAAGPESPELLSLIAAYEFRERFDPARTIALLEMLERLWRSGGYSVSVLSALLGLQERGEIALAGMSEGQCEPFSYVDSSVLNCGLRLIEVAVSAIGWDEAWPVFHERLRRGVSVPRGHGAGLSLSKSLGASNPHRMTRTWLPDSPELRAFLVARLEELVLQAEGAGIALLPAIPPFEDLGGIFERVVSSGVSRAWLLLPANQAAWCDWFDFDGTLPYWHERVDLMG